LGMDWRVRYEVGSGAVEPVQPQRDDEDTMLAEAGRDAVVDAPRRDPEEAALELLQNELGARRIDGP
ncbi:MAG TPA: DNA polymerase III subunit gamma/tau, partial [Mycobacterium sp.]|nr:DNA polymerase III subunit gamma/tau [Mycobacterium sp.]